MIGAIVAGYAVASIAAMAVLARKMRRDVRPAEAIDLVAPGPGEALARAPGVVDLSSGLRYPGSAIREAGTWKAWRGCPEHFRYTDDVCPDCGRGGVYLTGRTVKIDESLMADVLQSHLARIDTIDRRT